jgi:hypothetical protein
MRRSIRVECMRHAVEQHRRIQKQGSPHRLAIVELRYACAAIAKGAAMHAHRHCGRDLGNENKHTKKRGFETRNGANEQKLFEWNYQLLQGSSSNSLQLT